MLVKICGITNVSDACVAQDAGADFIGLIFAESKRQIHPDAALDITGTIHTPAVGVFRNQSWQVINDICDYADLQYVQLHGEEDPEFIPKIQRPVIKAFRIHADFDFKSIKNYGNCYALLLDTFVAEQPGGTGKTFDWTLMDKVRQYTSLPIFLSGGLTPENILDAVRLTQPDGVDVASGVESAPGIKDPILIQRFISRISDQD